MRYKGSMFLFSLRSEVVTVASELQAPCSVPPVEVTVRPRVPWPYISILVELNCAYVLVNPFLMVSVMMVPTDKVDPSCTKSNTDSEEPKRTPPKIDSAEPSRAKLLSDKVEPKPEKSKTDSDEPQRAERKTENVDPRRATDRRDSEEPRWNKSKTDIAEPKRARPWTEI